MNNISFMIGKKERIGLIGRNGAGKSTLLKIIGDIMRPDKGKVEMPANTTIGYLKQEFELDESQTVLEETMSCFEEANRLNDELDQLNEEISKREDYESKSYGDLITRIAEISAQMEHFDLTTLEANAVKVLKGLGFQEFELRNKVNTLSGGWKMRIELTKLLLREPDLLLLDEPTNHLDIESIIWLENYLINYSGIVILISHDTTFLNNVTNRILEIELGRLHEFKGTYKKYIVEKAQLREIQQNAYENQQKAIAQKERTITRFMAKATKTKMAQSMKKQLDKVERIEILDENTENMNIRFAEVPRSGRDILTAKKVSKSFGEKNVLNEIDIVIERGDRVAFVGQNGQGKTTLAKILIGNLEPTSGEVIQGHNLHVSYYAQNQSELLNAKKTVLEVMEDKAPESLRSKARTILGSFMFSGEDSDKKVSVLSGGERARLAMASLVMHPCNVLLLDEPTNHLDIQSKEILKNALKSYSGTLIVVSHDRDFLSGLTDKVIEFKDQKLNEYLGDIEYYLNKRKLDDMRAVELQKSTTQKTKTSEQPPESNAIAPKKLSREEEKQIKRKIQYLERDMEKLEGESKQIEEKMADPAFYKDPDFNKENDRYQQMQKELNKKMEEWEEWVEKL
ncbi:MAG: ABC-F family ATP-binding cassette domain-containing protein [Saprospiraceae bacterium]|nr:ABC-F family ATP-binding cassette domain-containing protein [Saprospiraceae bacterium]